MAASQFTGPLVSFGSMDALSASMDGPVPDPSVDAGPSQFYQGSAMPDVRIWYQKDRASGNAGMVPATVLLGDMPSIDQIPAALGTATIAALAHTTASTAMTLLATNTVAASANIPIVPFSGALNGLSPVTAALVLDFGFAYGNVTANSTTVAVADSTQFSVGMPLVIAGVGNSGNTLPLLTWVASITDATHIVINDSPAGSLNPAPIGTGNLWTPREGIPTLYPTAAMPVLAKGIGLFLDPRQAVARAVSVTCNSASGTGGHVTVAGWDVYGQPMSEKIAIAPGTALTAYGKKAFKAITSATPDFTDGTYTYSVGTSDTFGFHWHSPEWELVDVCWDAATMTAATGWTAGDTTSPATTTTGDVRGTIQVSADGAGSGIGSTASNGTISSLARSGHRLLMGQVPRVCDLLAGTPTSTTPMFGQTQA